MRIYLFALLTLFLISCNDDEFSVDCLPASLQDGVIAFYPFVNGDLTDGSSNDNAVMNNTSAVPSEDRAGNLDCAYEFNNTSGDDEFLLASDPDFLDNLNRFSVSLWYEPLDTNRSAALYEVLVGRGSEGHCPDRRGEWSVGLFDCRRAVFGHDNSVWAHNSSGGCISEILAVTEEWHHVVAIKDQDSYEIYFNGALQETATGIANCSNPHIAEDIGDFFIGTNFTGRIDDILIYNRALSPSEVTELFEVAPCCR